MKEFEFYKNLTDEEKRHILNNSKYIEIEKNFTLFNQGDICRDILFLEEGSVELLIYADVGEVIPLYEIKKGEQCIVNVSSTISNTPAIATAQTTTQIKGWLSPAKIVQELMINSPTYQQYIFSLFSVKFTALTTLIEDIKFKRLDSRIISLLKKENNDIIQITHEEIASKLGTSRVVVSRVLKELENKEIVKLHRKKIELLK